MISRNMWLFVCVVLWGIPIGILVSLTLAFIETNKLTDVQLFQQGIFINNLYVFIPVFIVLGIIFGLSMYKLGEKYRDESN